MASVSNLFASTTPAAGAMPIALSSGRIDPLWVRASDVLDQLSTAVGSLAVRTATGWQALQPAATAGWVLTNVGVGSPPTWQAAGAGSGTVSSVALALPSSVFSISGSPVTTTGTLTGAFATQLANTFFAGPTTGAAAVPAFRAMVIADIPATGTPSGTTYLRGDGTWSTVSASATPAGSTTQIQYNNAGAFGASAGLTWNDTTKTLALTGALGSGLSTRVSITNTNSGGYADHYLFNDVGKFVGFQMAGSAVGTANFAVLSTNASTYLNISTLSNVPIIFSITGSAGDCGRWSTAANWLVGISSDTGITGAGGIRTKNSVLVGDGSVAGTTIAINSSSYTLLQYNRSSVTKFSTGTANAANDFITGSVQDDMNFKSDASKSINFSVDNGTSMVFRCLAGNRLLMGGATDDGSTRLQVNGALKISSAVMIATATSFTNGAGASAGTLANAPAVGNPTKWIPINDNGTTRYIPAW